MKSATNCFLTLVLLCCLTGLQAKADPPNTMINRTTWELTQVPGIATETGRLKFSLQVADFEPTGVRATANTTLTILVEQLSGTDLPKLIMGTYDRQTVTTYSLTAGVNTITNVNGGDLYLQFSSATPSAQNKVRVTFQSGYQLMPLYIQGVTTHTDWLNMLAADTTSPNATLISERVFIVVSRIKAVEYRNENQDTLLRLMDRVMEAENAISGLDNSSPVHAPMLRNKIMMLEKASGNPDATSLGRVRIPTGSINWILSPSYILNSGGWGVFHELGHHHQQFSWSWSTCIEVTVNIYSLAAKRAIHPGQQGASASDWNTIMEYLALPQASKNFNASSVALFTRLGMFNQLWLAYGDGFYHTLHKRVREEAPAPSGDAAEMRLFMLMSCQISGHNLGQFFRNWGLNVNETVYDELNALGYPAPPVDPSTLREDLVATITTPASNAVYPAGSGVSLAATAFGRSSIQKVAFYQGNTLIGEDSTRPFTLDWNNAPPASYSLTAKAYAANGDSVTSPAVSITVEAVTLTSPVNNSSFAAGAVVPLQANAFGAIQKVDFYADSVLIGSSSTAPFSFAWQAAPGTYQLTALAISLQGDTVRSSGAGIVVGGKFPVADAYVRDASYAAINYGTASTIVVKKDGNSGFSRISYLQFNLDSIVNPGVATLRLNLAGAGNTITNTQWLVYRCANDNWTETGITWNNKPDTVSLLAATPGKKTGYAEWDLTGAVTTELAGDKLLTLAVVSAVAGQTNDASFYARESVVPALRPVLLLKDTAAPQITAPADLTVYTLPFGTTAIVETGMATAADNTGIASIVSNAPGVFSPGTTTVTWTATDFSGNTATATQLITVRIPQSKFSGVTVSASAAHAPDRKVDLQAQLFRNGELVASGALLSQSFAGSGLPVARELTIPLTGDSVAYTPGDEIVLKVLARKAGNKDFKFNLWYGGDSTYGKGGSRLHRYTPAYPDGQYYFLREQFLLSPAMGHQVAQITRTVTGEYQEIGSWSTAQSSIITGTTQEGGTIAEVRVGKAAGAFGVKVFPNPSSGQFTLNIQQTEAQPVLVVVRNVAGQLVQQYRVTGGQSLTIGADWKAGMYVAEVWAAGERKLIRLVKQ
ncbi:M60 family metallopeptidase [Paraflavitalea sp. CAU 1676]|uniref:M60 family metallopeptidase n=1 Tax=Paraflavitalea sp. CAU 1676 TaxID=3032598 RepID=UPI0023DC5664|nr:M60 family metallopeptidase [Paraflavitalea sp. CAU 1676]MDF2192737.1 M60 family metallopeptidase [Paraflavitalea sp. CAU 1676]